MTRLTWTATLLVGLLLTVGCNSSKKQTEDDSKPTAEASQASTEQSAETDESSDSAEKSGESEHGHAHEGHTASESDDEKKPQGHRFTDPEKYADDWNDPARDAWQKPDEVMDLMGLEAGMTVADLGTGTGYFVPHLSERVGSDGLVLALDIEAEMVDYVRERADKLELGNVEARKVAVDDPGLADGEVDRVLTVNTWHHIPDRQAYVRKLAAGLAPGGALVVVDYTKEADRGPPKSHRFEPQEVAKELQAGGLETTIAEEGLPKQFVVIGRKTADE